MSGEESPGTDEGQDKGRPEEAAQASPEAVVPQDVVVEGSENYEPDQSNEIPQ